MTWDMGCYLLQDANCMDPCLGWIIYAGVVLSKQMAKTEKKYKARVVNRVLYPVIGLFAWTVFSFAMVEIPIENFNNEENYLMLGL